MAFVFFSAMRKDLPNEHALEHKVKFANIFCLNQRPLGKTVWCKGGSLKVYYKLL